MGQRTCQRTMSREPKSTINKKNSKQYSRQASERAEEMMDRWIRLARAGDTDACDQVVQSGFSLDGNEGSVCCPRGPVMHQLLVDGEPTDLVYAWLAGAPVDALDSRGLSAADVAAATSRWAQLQILSAIGTRSKVVLEPDQSNYLMVALEVANSKFLAHVAQRNVATAEQVDAAIERLDGYRARLELGGSIRTEAFKRVLSLRGLDKMEHTLRAVRARLAAEQAMAEIAGITHIAAATRPG